MDHEHNQQVATEGRAGGRGCRQASPACLLRSLQPEGLHATPTLRLPGPQGVLQDRLSRDHGHPGRYAQPRRRGKRRPRVKRAAVDSSGFEAHHTSHYFVRRRAKGRKHWQITTYRRFPKLAILTDCSNHLVLAALAGRGPGPDITHFERIVCQGCPRVLMETLLADAGYDAEWVHCVAREDLGIRSLIPPKVGRSTDKPPTGHYRRLMSQRLHLTSYGQRWQVETTFSMIKRRLRSPVNARSYWSQCRALMLKALAHNVLIL